MITSRFTQAFLRTARGKTTKAFQGIYQLIVRGRMLDERVNGRADCSGQNPCVNTRPASKNITLTTSLQPKTPFASC